MIAEIYNRIRNDLAKAIVKELLEFKKKGKLTEEDLISHDTLKSWFESTCRSGGVCDDILEEVYKAIKNDTKEAS